MYAVLKIVNGNFTIDSEWGASLQGAIIQWHDVCKILWNAKDVITAYVKVINEQGNQIEEYGEFIHHDVTA